MTPTRARPLRDVLAMLRDEWDRDETRPAVREAFAKVVDCGTEALGAEVFASDCEERVVYHTCKSRACPSCGQFYSKRSDNRKIVFVPALSKIVGLLNHIGQALERFHPLKFLSRHV